MRGTVSEKVVVVEKVTDEELTLLRLREIPWEETMVDLFHVAPPTKSHMTLGFIDATSSGIRYSKIK